MYPGRGSQLVAGARGVAGRLAVAIRVVAVALGPRAAHRGQLISVVIRERGRPFLVLLAGDAIGIVVAIDVRHQAGVDEAAVLRAGDVGVIGDRDHAVGGVVADRRIHVLVARPDRAIDVGQAVGSVVGVEDLGSG